MRHLTQKSLVLLCVYTKLNPSSWWTPVSFRLNVHNENDNVKFLHPTWHKNRSFRRDFLPSQSLSLVLMKQNLTQQKQRFLPINRKDIVTQSKHQKLKPGFVALYDVQRGNGLEQFSQDFRLVLTNLYSIILKFLCFVVVKYMEQFFLNAVNIWDFCPDMPLSLVQHQCPN